MGKKQKKQIKGLKKALAAKSAKKVRKETGPRHFVNLTDFDKATLKAILKNARRLKKEKYAHVQIFGGQSLAMIFDKPSTRTRMSFALAFKQLGGHVEVLNKSDIQLGNGENVYDTAKVMSRYVDAMMVRVSSHQMVEDLAKHSEVPVINALTDASHPCQIMADLMTIQEHGKKLKGLNVTWLGDDNNVSKTLAQAAGIFGFTLTMSSPKHLPLDGADYKGKHIKIERNPQKAVKGADVVVTDTWRSMGQAAKDNTLFEPYQVNAALMAKAKEDAIFLHCLPAHRGEEVTSEVMDGPQSVVFDEAENRLHVQKAILAWCLAKSKVRVRNRRTTA